MIKAIYPSIFSNLFGYWDYGGSGLNKVGQASSSPRHNLGIPCPEKICNSSSKFCKSILLDLDLKGDPGGYHHREYPPGGIQVRATGSFQLKGAGVLLKAPFGCLSFSSCPCSLYRWAQIPYEGNQLWLFLSTTKFFGHYSDARKVDNQVNWE